MNITRVFLGGWLLASLGPLGLSADPANTSESDADRDVWTQIEESVDRYNAGDFQGSLEAADSALQTLRLQEAIAYNNVCSARMRLGLYEQAIDACRKALDISPAFERAQNNLGWIFETQAATAPTVGVYLDLGTFRYRQGALDESIAASEAALELDPDSAIAHNNLCAAYAKSERWEEAVRECEKALELDPDYPRASNNLAWASTREPLTDD